MGTNGFNELDGAGSPQHIPDGAADSAEPCVCEDGLQELRARLAEAERTVAEGEDKYLRLLADFQNFRNRSAKDLQLGVEQAERQMLLETLQVMDSFRRCLGSTYGSIEDFRAGVGLIERQFDAALRRLGVSEIEMNVGDAFDAHVADALTAVKSADFAPGCIVDICERGYMVGGRLLRPARVVVAAAADDAP